MLRALTFMAWTSPGSGCSAAPMVTDSAREV
jgi:hypothetical protein